MIISGIYIITNLHNNKVYVGQSIDVYSRLSSHKRKLNNNTHNNIHLQNSFNYFGIINFSFELLEEYSEEFLHSFENYWCNMLYSHNKKYGYNIKPTSPNGISKQSEETKSKISLTNTGKICLESTKGKIKNKLLLSFSEGRHSLINNKEHYQKVSENLIGNNHASGQVRTKKQLDNLSKCRVEIVNKRVLQYSLDSVLIKEWYTTVEAANFYKISYKAIWNAIKRKSKSAGYYWEYKEKIKY